MKLAFETLCGDEIEGIVPALAQLRLKVFREYPYLYEGDLSYEYAYLERYILSPRSMIFAVYEGHTMVGATTCLPLADEMEDLQKPFRKAKRDPHRHFYFGESILMPAYRGQGMGHRFFDAREAHARQWTTFTHSCFCAVDRPEDHPQRPADYRSHDAFWIKRGYEKIPSLQGTMAWRDVGKPAITRKTLTFWLKRL
jgi:GNAT superfamily N-acetyltransferase